MSTPFGVLANATFFGKSGQCHRHFSPFTRSRRPPPAGPGPCPIGSWNSSGPGNLSKAQGERGEQARTCRSSGGAPWCRPWPWRGALELLRCCYGVATVLLPWASLGHPLGSPWVALGFPWGFRQPNGVSTEPQPGFDSIGLAAIQEKLHFPMNLLPAACRVVFHTSCIAIAGHPLA